MFRGRLTHHVQRVVLPWGEAFFPQLLHPQSRGMLVSIQHVILVCMRSRQLYDGAAVQSLRAQDRFMYI